MSRNLATDGTPLGPGNERRWRSSQPRVHETAIACPNLAATQLAVTIVQHPYDKGGGGKVLHLTDAEARDLMTWLIRRYSAIDALAGLV